MGDSGEDVHYKAFTRTFSATMRYTARKSLMYLLVVTAFLLYGTGQALGIVVHPNEGEPNLMVWTDRPEPNVVGRWSSNASFVVITPNWIITTRHQNTSPSTVTIAGLSYTCHYKDEWTGGPAEQPPGDVDMRLVRLTTTDGENPNLPDYASPYTDTDEKWLQVVMGGYGKGRGSPLEDVNGVYGYEWSGSSNNTQRWGQNKVDWLGTGEGAGYTSDVIVADFDAHGAPGAQQYEAAIAGWDSGGGWFIKDGDEWKAAGISRGATHPEESWFSPPDYIDAVRISSYADWIFNTINVDGDLTGDDWVDFADFAVFARHWQRCDCNEQNEWCQGADFEPTYGIVDWYDLAALREKWLTGWQY